MSIRIWAATRRLAHNDRRIWLITFGLIGFLYLMTAHWRTGQVNDSLAAIWPAWHLAHHGSFDIAGASGNPNLAWFVELEDGRVVVQRTMGVLLAGLPVAFMTSFTSLDAAQTGALAAALYAAAAMANMHLLLRKVVSPGLALSGVLSLALGTSVWTTAAAELWTHGPNIFWLSAALLLICNERHWLAGAALAPAVMTRPHLALVAIALGFSCGIAARSLRPVLAVGLPAATSVPLLMAWNNWYYGSGSVLGAYSGHKGAATAAPSNENVFRFLQDAAGAFISPSMGVLVYSPVLILLIICVPRGWALAPHWARGAFLGGLTYELLQLRLNRYHGGGVFFGNRLVVELLVLCTPLMIIGFREWVSSVGRQQVAAALTGYGIAIHAFGALTAPFWTGALLPATSWYPAVLLRTTGLPGVLIFAALMLIPVVCVKLVRETMKAHVSGESSVRVPEQRAGASAEQHTPSSGAPAPLPGAAASTLR